MLTKKAIKGRGSNKNMTIVREILAAKIHDKKTIIHHVLDYVQEENQIEFHIGYLIQCIYESDSTSLRQQFNLILLQVGIVSDYLDTFGPVGQHACHISVATPNVQN
jgi:hypothetical protein